MSYSETLPPAVMEFQPAPTPSFPLPPDPRLNQPVSTPRADSGLRSVKAAAELSAREYLALLRASRQRYDDPATARRLLTQRDVVLADLQALRGDVSALVRAGESHRWGRWVLGGIVATLIPAVRKVFRRSADEDDVGAPANDTEYAFARSKSLVSRIVDSVRGRGALASVAFFVLSVLYVFQAEVSLRVAKTVSKRLKKLAAKIERGDEAVGERDLEIFQSWRWRVLMWKS